MQGAWSQGQDLSEEIVEVRVLRPPEDRVWTLRSGEPLSVGKRPDCHVVIRGSLAPRVSRHHLTLERRGDQLMLHDMGGAGGTWWAPADEGDPPAWRRIAPRAFAQLSGDVQLKLASAVVEVRWRPHSGEKVKG